MEIVIVVIEKLIDIFNSKFSRQISSSFNQWKYSKGGAVIWFACKANVRWYGNVTGLRVNISMLFNLNCIDGKL